MAQIFWWREEYSVGIKEIDEQHKQWVNILNELGTALLEFKGHEVVESVLKRLINFTREHFATEERLFKKYNYPEEKAHKAEHDKLLEKVSKFQQDYDRGHKMVGVDLMEYLKNWFKDHVQTTDYRYAPFFKELGVNKIS